MLRVPAQVFQRRARPVGAAPEIDPVVAQRRARRIEIRDPRRRRVLRGIHALRGQLARAGSGLRHRIELERAFEAVVGLERRADERRRPAGAALVDEDDVAILADAGQRGGERTEKARGLTGPAGENEQRVGARVQRVGRKDRDEQRDLAAAGLASILGHLEGAALRGERKLRQPAVGEHDRATRPGAIAAAPEAERECGEDGRGQQHGGTGASGHRGGC